MIEKLLERLTRNWKARTIRRDLSVEPPYLTRWYLRHMPKMPDGSFPFDEIGRPRPGAVDNDESYSVFLHRFGQDDEDDVHDHPWEWACSLILFGGYIEERYDTVADKYTTRVLRPFEVNFLRHTDFHRVTLIGGQPCWSLFITGKRTKSWGFIDRKTGLYYHWSTYFAMKRPEASP